MQAPRPLPPAPEAEPPAALARHLAAVLATSPDLFFLFGPARRFRYASPAALDALGLELSQMQGKSWQELGFPPEIMLPFEHKLLEAIASGAPVRGETHFPTRYGLRFYDYHLAPLYGADGTLEGVASTTRDITDLVIANRKLREQQERFRGAFRFSAIGMALVGLDGKLLKVNPALCRIVGYSEAELVAMSVQDITHPDDVECDFALYDQLQRGEIETYQLEKRYIHRAGNQLWLKLTVALVRDEAGVPLYAVGQVEEITRQKEAEAKLEEANRRLRQANRLKDEFISVVAHELKNPLSILKGYSVLLENQALGPLSPEQQHAMRQIRTGTDLLIHHVNDLLDLGMIQAGHFTLNVQPVALDLLVARTLGLFALSAEQQSLSVTVAIQPDLPILACDEKRIGQVLHNLLSNAIKFTPPGGRITVRAEATRETLRCAVSDTGPGISAEDVPRLFKRFSQLSGVPGLSGNGLGLSISKALVEAHGGAMGVESEGPGRGSTFWFTLPLTGAEPSLGV
ncbi:Non-motile and phage-resistance protein [compost metagenome]